MSLKINRINVTSITVQKGQDGVSIAGNYELISEKGTVVAKIGFNGYNEAKFEIDKKLLKNFIDEIESTIEIETGIQEVLKAVKEKP